MDEHHPQLTPRLTLVDAAALALGAIIGAGIFVVLGDAAGTAGAALPAAILLAAAAALCNALSAVALGVNYPRAGGAYEFGYQLLSPLTGFAAGWLFLLAGITSSAVISLAFAAYLQPLVPGVGLRPAAVALAVAAVGVNALGVRLSSIVNNVLVFVKVAVLLVFISVGAWWLTQGLPLPAEPALWTGVPSAAALVFFAFTGYARPVTVVEEMQRPRRDLPAAVLAALGLATGLYLAVAVVGLALVGPAGLAATEAPLRAALAPIPAAWAQNLMSVGGVVAAASVLLTEVWGASRLAFAMARRGDLPAPLAALERGGVPRTAVLALGGLVVLLTAVADLSPVLAAASLSLLVYYALMNAAALRLSTAQRLYPRIVSVAGLLFCLVLAFSLPWQAIALVGLALAAGLLYRLARAWGARRGL